MAEESFVTAADLTLVGVSEDGRHLLLRDRAGTQYQLLLDAALRSAVRHEHTRPQTSERPQMSPREVQTLIRAGASADEVAEMSGWPPEKIAKYEGPVLAEREFVASLATQVRLHSMTGSTLLATRVAERLAAREVDPESASWDAWRASGRPWTLQLAFPAGGRLREARWTFDVQTRTVTPEDDEARWLSADSDSRPAPFVPLSNQVDDTPSGYAAPAAYEPWDADVHAPAAMSLEEAVEAVAPLQVEDAPRPTDAELEESLRRRSKGRRGLLHRAPRADEPSSAAGDDAGPQGAEHPSPAPAAQQPQDEPEATQDAPATGEGDASAERGDTSQPQDAEADEREDDVDNADDQDGVSVVPGTLATAVGGEELVEAVVAEQDDETDAETDAEPGSDDADTHETDEAPASDTGRPGPASLTAGSTGSDGALEATPDVAALEPAAVAGELAAATEATPIGAAASAIALPAAPAAPQVKEIGGEEDVPAQAASPAQSAPAAPQDETTDVVTEVDVQEQAAPQQRRRSGQRQQPRKGARNQRPAPAGDAPAPAAEQPQRSRKQPAQKKKSSRASVPSWDDIMFGSKKD